MTPRFGIDASVFARLLMGEPAAHSSKRGISSTRLHGRVR